MILPKISPQPWVTIWTVVSQPWVTIWTVVLLAPLIMGGCVEGNTKKPQATVGPDSDRLRGQARVAPQWQKQLSQEFITATAATNGYLLVSSGGWSDAGQVLVLTENEGKTQLVGVQPAKTEISIRRALTAPEWTALRPLLQTAVKLSDIQVTSFDGVVFEFVALDKAETPFRVTHRFVFRNPMVTAEHKKLGPEQWQVIKEMMKLLGRM